MMRISIIAKCTLLLVVALAAPTAQALNYELTLPEGTAGHIRVKPGEVGSFAYDIRNLEAQAGTAIGFGQLIDFEDAYQFGSGEPAQCGVPYLTYPTATARQWNFPATLGPNASLRCTYPVTRSASSGSDTKLYLCVRQNDGTAIACDGTQRTLMVGTLPDIAVSVSPVAQVAPGTSEVIVSVSVQNQSDVGVGKVWLASECRPAIGRPYTMHVDFEGACPRVNINPGCYYNSGPGVPTPIFNWLIETASTAPLGTSSCLVKMRFTEPLNAPLVDTLQLRRPPQDPFPPVPLLHPANAYGRDVNASNDGPRPFGATPFVATPVPSSDRIAWVCLIVLLGVLAARHHRRRLKLD